MNLQTDNLLHYSQEKIIKYKRDEFGENCKALCDATYSCKAIVISTDGMNCWLKDDEAAKTEPTQEASFATWKVVY
jgi:hypothetical protein